MDENIFYYRTLVGEGYIGKNYNYEEICFSQYINYNDGSLEPWSGGGGNVSTAFISENQIVKIGSNTWYGRKLNFKILNNFFITYGYESNLSSLEYIKMPKIGYLYNENCSFEFDIHNIINYFYILRL